MPETITPHNLCAVVVWYNPTDAVAARILRYSAGVRTLFIIDNSDKTNQPLVDAMNVENVSYHFLGENKGVAAALNAGFQYARECQAEWVMTMDQDSIFDPDAFDNYIRAINRYPNPKETGIFAIKQDFGITDPPHRTPEAGYYHKKRVMCSGNIVSVEAHKKVGGYREDFFMDWVDFEFCARIKIARYRIIECTGVRLTHFLGDRLMTATFFGAKKYVPDYPLWRKYYLARNIYLTGKTHRTLRASMYWRLVQEFKQVLLYDHSPKKWEKMKAMCSALLHARRPVNVADIQQKYR